MAETVKVEKIQYNERPKYRILDVAGFFSDNDTLYEYLDEIYFDGEPAIEMEPLNEAAKEKYVSLLESLDEEARKTAEKLGRPFSGRPRTIDGALAIATAVQRLEMPAMGAKDKETTTESAGKFDELAQGSPNVKRGRGRPRRIV